MKILNEKIFVLIVLYVTFSKNSLALYFKNIEISVAMNMLSLEHLINENNSAIEAFDSVAEIDTSSKNSLIQHIENSKTLKKNSICELFAFFAFDNIDIDFSVYTSDIEAIIQHFVTSLTSFTSSIALQFIEETSDYEREQTICFAERTTSNENRKKRIEKYDDEVITKIYHATSYYEKKQIICSTNTVTASDITTKSMITKTTITKSTVTKSTTKINVTKSVVHHALLIHYMI